MAKLDEVHLMNGEVITAKLEGDAFNTSPNPMLRLLATILKIVSFIFGVKQKIFLYATNKRVIKVSKTTILWFLDYDTVVENLNFNSFTAIGYSQARRWLVFKSLFFRLEAKSGFIDQIKFQGTVQELNTVLVAFNDVIYGNSHVKAIKAA